MIIEKKKKVVELSCEAKKWNKMWDMWVEGEIESPYKELMEYLNGVNNGGHYCHFDNVSGNNDLKEYVDNLTKILPDVLRDNVLTAYNTYIANPDDMSDEDNDILDKCDSIYFEHEELVNDILKARAELVEL